MGSIRNSNCVRCVLRVRLPFPLRQAVTATLLALCLLAPCKFGGRSAADSAHLPSSHRAKVFNCGYDHNGAADEWLSHRTNIRSHDKHKTSSHSTSIFSLSSLTQSGEVAVAQDDGTIVFSPTRFNLKNTSLLFTPETNGYRVSAGDIGFNKNLGGRLSFFFGVDGGLENGDNGYRDVRLQDAQFPFYGVFYDTIYVGTNGYITFTKGDTTARLSPTMLASDIPRIAPLWADLEVADTGDIFYNRLEDRHIITWSGAGQPSYDGLSTFQAVLFDDGRIGFAYRKVKAQAALVGISPGSFSGEPSAVDFSSPPSGPASDPIFQMFGKQQRLDLPALLRAFYRSYPDTFDTAFVWTDFDYDNGLGIAHSFNVRNQIAGIGLKRFDRGLIYGSPERLSTIITMGNEANWPGNPQAQTAGLNSAISIVCHEQGHRWLAYVRFDANHEIKDDLLGRENAHWSFLVDTRTNPEGTSSSLMEGNAWRSSAGGIFTTTETTVNYFTPLDQYLMGLRPPDDVADIPYLLTDPQIKEFLREKSPFSGFSLSAIPRTTSVAQIIEHEGPRIPDFQETPKVVRVAFILLTQQDSAPSSATLEKLERYRNALVRYFSIATEGRAEMQASLNE